MSIDHAEQEGARKFSPENIPEELRRRRQWVNRDDWKIPQTPGTKRRADSTDSETWRSFEDAVADGRGLGFVFTSGDPYTGVDLDKCRDPETGVVEEWAREIVEDLDGYVEISPSGTGFHIFVRGKLPKSGRRGKVEAYSSERYFAMTGDGLKREIPERQEQLDRFHRKHLEAALSAPQNSTATASPSSMLSDDEIIEKLLRESSGKGKRLMDGDTGDYENDESRADLALVSKLHFYSQDFEQVDRLFRRSGLYREKWERADYRHRTFMKAANSTTEVWQPGSIAKPGREAMDDENLSRPKIRVNGRYLREVTDDTLEAIRLANDPAEMFIRSGALVRVVEDENSTPIIQNMDMNHVKERADHVADFVRVAKQGDNWIKTKVNPPEVAIKNLMARASLPFPPLEAVVESPILRPDGSICAAPGYDPKTRLYYRPAPGFECPEIPEKPAREDVRSALDLINEAVGEFPYSDRASAANTLALLITMLIRPAIPGLIPLGLIDAPQAGTGKSLLAEVLVKMGTGRDAEMAGDKRTDEEWGKQITSQLIAGRTTIIIDNVEGALHAPNLARALTSKTWTDRVLGLSKMATVRQRATWIATGNNIILRGDLPRRCYWIRLDAKESRPWKREKFKHTNLREWAADHRGELVGAALTIARAWHDAGKPKAQNVPKLGSFEEWTEIIGGILQYAGVEGFLGNLEELYDKADEGNAEWEVFLEAWWTHKGDDKISVKDLAKLIEKENSLKDALPGDLSESLDKGEGSFTRRLGTAISKRVGTHYGDDGLHISEAGEFRRAKLWRIQDSTQSVSCVSFVSLYTPYAGKNDCNKDIQAGANTGDSASGGSEKDSPDSQTHTKAADEPSDYEKLVEERSKEAAEDVIAAEMRRSNSGAAKNLPHFLAGTTSLELLTKSVLRGLGKEGGWLAHAEAVEKAAADPANHPPGCGCGDCS